MLRLFTFLSLSLSFISIGSSQTIVDYTLLAEYTKADLQAILDDFGIPTVILPVYYDIEVYKITYNTPDGPGTGMTTATGAAVFPKGYFCNLPLACYAHGTASNKMNVPSYGSSEQTIGLLWAGRGYVTAMPDYLGLGDSPGLHPYQHSKSEASACIDMIRATKELGANLGHNIGEDLFLYGYSQGGHSAVATMKEIQEFHADEMTVTACIGMSGAYDMIGAQTDFINSGLPYATPGYLPYIFLGYHSIYGNLYNNSVSEALVPPYDTLLPPIFFEGATGIGTINGICEPIPTDMVVPAYQNDFETNPNNPFRVALVDNGLVDWTPQAPIRLLYCEDDEQVSYLNSEVARDSFVSKGAPDVHAVNFGPYDHGGCVQFCLLSALTTMDSFKMGPYPMLDLVVSYEESSPGAMDGSIVLIPHPQAGNLNIVWNTGATGSTLSNIGSGSYSATITNDLGCEASFEFEFDQLLANNNPISQDLDFFPNPARDIVQLQLPELADYQLDISDINGRTVQTQSFMTEGNHSLDVSELQTGIYFISLKDMDRGQQYVAKVIIE